MKDINLKKIKKVHFIGIGGIGISALAQLMHHDGKIVSGTNDNPSPQTLDRIRALGVKIYLGADIKNISSDTDLIVYSLAWDDMEPDFMHEVRAFDVPVLTYFEALGLASKDKDMIAIAGTHGKTTTTAMVAKMLIETGNDPTVIVGSVLKEQQGNFVSGKSEYFVVEACEYRRSFLNLRPRVAIITNIDNDHLDYYKDIDDIISAFHEFALKVPNGGFIIADVGDRRIDLALKGIEAHIIDFSKYDVSHLDLKMPGRHNKRNAQAAIALADVLDIDSAKAIDALDDFAGTWRRFEFKGGTKKGAIIYDDYGHHPTEVKATLSGAREKFPNKHITVVFQPHLYSRTKLLLDDFARAFKDADMVVLAPIYSAREPFDPDITSEILSEKICANGGKSVSLPDFQAIEKYLKRSLKSGDMLITMGAGDIYKVGEKLVA